MSKFQTEEDLVACLSRIDLDNHLDALEAMPNISTLSKLNPEKSDPYFNSCIEVGWQKEFEFTSHHVAYLYNSLMTDDDLIAIAWEIQKFAFYMEFIMYPLVDSAYSQYKLLLKKLGEVEWPKETLAELKANIEESRIPKNEFLPELLYAGSKSEIQRANEDIAKQTAAEGLDPNFRIYHLYNPKEENT